MGALYQGLFALQSAIDRLAIPGEPACMGGVQFYGAWMLSNAPNELIARLAATLCRAAARLEAEPADLDSALLFVTAVSALRFNLARAAGMDAPGADPC